MSGPDDRPIVIGHRGASGHRPENTLAAFELAYRLGADSVELDVIATKDGALVCRHDVEISRTTDVAAQAQFAHLRRTIEIDDEPVTGWFVPDFTLAELRQLTTRERWPKKRAGSATHDSTYPIPTLAEAIALRDTEAQRSGRHLGIHVEIKSPEFLRTQGIWLPDLLRGLVGADLTWLSFDEQALVDLAAPRMVRLFDKSPGAKDIARAAEYAGAIGVRRKAVLRRDGDGRIAGPASGPSGLVGRAHDLDLDVLVWTHRAENQHLPVDLQIGPNPHGHGDAAGEAELLFAAGIDGLITDFPEIALLGLSRLPGRAIAR
jgi:glycerophosphoryl diester phosphodiesterase